jgi:hypothetical protein
MLQRIQSLYLFIVFALLLAMYFNSLAIFFDSSGKFYMLLYIGIAKLTSNSWIILKHNYLTTFLLIISSVLVLVCIFLYKNRKVQIKGCYILIVVLILFSGCILLTYKSVQLECFMTSSHLSIVSILPNINSAGLSCHNRH